MDLKDYFESENDYIRVKGHRIGIDVILDRYLAGDWPEMIQCDYPTLSLLEIYATITYYLEHRKEIDAYLQKNAQAAEAAYQAYLQKGPSEISQRLRELKKHPELLEKMRANRLQQLNGRQGA